MLIPKEHFKKVFPDPFNNKSKEQVAQIYIDTYKNNYSIAIPTIIMDQCKVKKKVHKQGYAIAEEHIGPIEMMKWANKL